MTTLATHQGSSYLDPDAPSADRTSRLGSAVLRAVATLPWPPPPRSPYLTGQQPAL
jgi:hypothetical protein